MKLLSKKILGYVHKNEIISREISVKSQNNPEKNFKGDEKVEGGNNLKNDKKNSIQENKIKSLEHKKVRPSIINFSSNDLNDVSNNNNDVNLNKNDINASLISDKNLIQNI